MKTLYLILLGVVTSSVSFGQKLTVTVGDSLVNTVALHDGNDVTELHGYLTNNTGSADSVFWYIRDINYPDQWEMSMCDPVNCYFFYIPSNQQVYKFNAAPGDANLLKFGASPYCQAGTGWYRAVMWLKSDSAGSVITIDFLNTYTGVCVSAINNITTQNVKVYPTSFTNNIKLSGLSGTGAKRVLITDVNGKLVYETALNSENDVTLAPAITVPGVYNLSIAGNTQVVYNTRIVRQ